MAGVKGRSGRKSTPDSEKRQRVIDLAWETVFETLSDKSVALSIRADLAKSIVTKNIPQEHQGEFEVVININNAITKQEDLLDTNGAIHGYRAPVSANN